MSRFFATEANRPFYERNKEGNLVKSFLHEYVADAVTLPLFKDYADALSIPYTCFTYDDRWYTSRGFTGILIEVKDESLVESFRTKIEQELREDEALKNTNTPSAGLTLLLRRPLTSTNTIILNTESDWDSIYSFCQTTYDKTGDTCGAETTVNACSGAPEKEEEEVSKDESDIDPLDDFLKVLVKTGK